MLKQISQLGLASFTLLGLANFPSLAQTTTTPTGNQEATVSGTNNQIYQTINQTIINHPGLGSINRNQNKEPKTNSNASSHRQNEAREQPRKNDEYKPRNH